MTDPATKGWRSVVLTHFPLGSSTDIPITLARDPDSLLGDELCVRRLTDRGFRVLNLGDPVRLRYDLASAGGGTDEASSPIIAWGGEGSTHEAPPYDMEALARIHSRDLNLGVGDIFPNLDRTVIRALDMSTWDQLYEAYNTDPPNRILTATETVDYALERVFSVAPQTVKSAADLLQLLLDRHYSGIRAPSLLDERLVEQLRARKDAASWPLEEIVPKSGAFFEFLQERWSTYVAEQLGHDIPATKMTPQLPGPSRLPFGAPKVRVYIDNLFREGYLEPIDAPRLPEESWISVGIADPSTSASADRARHLLEQLAGNVPTDDARVRDWMRCALAWAELSAERVDRPGTKSESDLPGMDQLRKELDTRFVEWLIGNFGSLSNLSHASGPVLVHHVLPYLRLRRGTQHESTGRTALIVVDGLALDQWLVLKRELEVPRSAFEEDTVLAWLPTMTSVSRQSLLAGAPPYAFADTIHSTHKEESRWADFWLESGVASNESVLVKQGKHQSLDHLLSEVSDSVAIGKSVIGVVVNQLDQQLHAVGHRKDLFNFLQGSLSEFLSSLLEVLRSAGFEAYLTSDHGNVEATGIGRPDAGSIPHTQAKRVHVYSSSILRGQYAEEYPGAIAWPPVGLPEDYLPLLAPGRGAFMKLGDRMVTHGGATLEEMVVPFITFGPA